MGNYFCCSQTKSSMVITTNSSIMSSMSSTKGFPHRFLEPQTSPNKHSLKNQPDVYGAPSLSTQKPNN